MLLSDTIVDFHLFYDGAVDIQICTLLTRSQCKVSDTQVTVKAHGPLVLKNMTLVMICKKNKILDFPYCTWSFLLTRSFYWYQNICPCDLGHQWNWPLSGAFVFHKHILFHVPYSH